ncbi:hypothetical protein ACFQ5M_05100 [Agrilactobacillus yilanensis]|uniref:Molecular chaperone DnaJ n=1 Tax=Agrilactobacillus yilanensis TaxID=2485997 RepID=A0ABW4J735_9LACO|nr:hypothetical protein [Agrilactobacillus yilanensis]
MTHQKQSLIAGITALIGFAIGFYTDHILVGLFGGLAIGYLITFWIPRFLRKRSKSDKKDV